MIRQVSTKVAREAVEKGDILGAILQISADLEFMFFAKLFFEKGIKSNLMKNWTLGKYIEWVSELNLINKPDASLLKDFNELRNLIVHGRYTIHNIMKDLDKFSFVASLIFSVCDFLDSVSVKYNYNQELEKEYGEFLEKINKKYERIFSNNFSKKRRTQKIIEESLAPS